MPELPEVENTRRYLVEIGLPGKTIALATIGWANSVRRPSLEDFVLDLPGGTVQAVNRRGKYLLAPLDTGQTWVLHLGMTGGLRIHPRNQPPPSMVRHTVDFTDGTQLRFIDPRKFGHLWLVDDVTQATGKMGPEPLSEDFNDASLALILSNRTAPIKALLLEQHIIAGLGNLYADDALYRAGIHPERPASGLSSEEIFRLRSSIVEALGHSLSQYDRSRRNHWPDPPFGLSPWLIPRSPGAPCVRCGNGRMEQIKVRGRTTFYCPACQPRPM